MVGIAATEERHQKTGINECAFRHIRRLQVLFRPRAQIARQPIDRADDVSDGVE